LFIYRVVKMQDDGPSCLECICYCNPFWSEEEEEDDENEMRKRVLDDDSLSLETPLSARDCDDPFTLPGDFDAIANYYASFEKCDTQGSKSGVLFKLLPENMKIVMDRLTENPVTGYANLASDILLLRTSILDSEGDDRVEKIKFYEYMMDRYDSCRSQDQDFAQLHLDNARSSLNKKEVRLEYYRKAIYYTHQMSKKLEIKKEYSTYCEILKKY
jgi:hypothetical protein